MKFASLLKTTAVLCASAIIATGCGSDKKTWTVTCPWAPSGVAAMASQKAASLSTTYSKDTILVAEAVKGDTATINTWVMDKKGGDPALTFINEGLLAISPIIDPKKVRFSEDDFVVIQNLYSAIFVLSSQDTLGLKNIDDLKSYVANGGKVNIAVNGATSTEAFLATALFNEMGCKDLKVTPYTSAAEAAQAVAKGETNFAISHQTQILETAQQGKVDVIAAFADKTLEHGPFAGVRGVGEYGYPYITNACVVAAKAGTSDADVKKLRELYDAILKDESFVKWAQETMLIEINPMSDADFTLHLEQTRDIVNAYKDKVLG